MTGQEILTFAAKTGASHVMVSYMEYRLVLVEKIEQL